MTPTIDPPAPARRSTPVQPANAGIVQRLVALLLIAGPIVAIVTGAVLLWGNALHPRDLVVAAALYVITGHGITVGFHRMFTHRSFKPNRILKVALAVAGSLAVQGSIIGWVASHRRHHMFSDEPGDPHSPRGQTSTFMGQLRGFAHAHIGWFFRSDPTSHARFAPDLLADRDITLI